MMKAALLLPLLFALPAAGQSDEGFIPYGEESQPESRRESDAPRAAPEKREDVWLARGDDPNTGLAGELIGGVLLLESARGSGVDPTPGAGVRLTWEFGRLTGDETLSEALFADVRWNWAASGEGTTRIRADSQFHLFTVAPAYAFPLRPNSDFAFFVQAGGGAAYQGSSIRDGDNVTQLGGVKPVLQYGAGFRGRPRVSDSGNLRISFRLEATRFRRGYMDDTFLGGSIGAAF